MRNLGRAVVSITRGLWSASPRLTAACAGLMVIGGISGPLTAELLKVVTDAALSDDAGYAVAAAVFLGFFALAQITLERLVQVLYGRLSDIYVIDLDDEMIVLAGMSPGLAHHERPDYADRLALLRQDFSVFRLSTQWFFWSIGLTAQVALTAVLLARVNPILLALPLVSIPALALGRRGNDLATRGRTASAENIRRLRHLFELGTSPAAAKEIRVFGIEDELSSRERRGHRELVRAIVRAESGAAVLRAASQVTLAIAYALSLYLVVREAISGQKTVGDVVLVLTLAAQVNQQMAGAVDLTNRFFRAATVFGHLAWLRSAVRQEVPPSGSRHPPSRLTDGLTLENVSFRYAGTDLDALERITLHVPPGKTVAIVGENGAGKSTLIKLLCRFYDPMDGRILVDGIDLRSFDLDSWRGATTAAFQDYARLEFTVQRSVGLGRIERLDDEKAALRALDAAGGRDVLATLPNGLATALGSSSPAGVGLSGGQWQRLAVGRAMMRTNPLLFVFDEPTAAMDADSEHLLFQRYNCAARRWADETGAITILVSHRFSTVRMADLIVVLDGGRIEQSGTHDELMNARGRYAELFEMQAAGYR